MWSESCEILIRVKQPLPEQVFTKENLPHYVTKSTTSVHRERTGYVFNSVTDLFLSESIEKLINKASPRVLFVYDILLGFITDSTIFFRTILINLLNSRYPSWGLPYFWNTSPKRWGQKGGQFLKNFFPKKNQTNEFSNLTLNRFFKVLFSYCQERIECQLLS